MSDNGYPRLRGHISDTPITRTWWRKEWHHPLQHNCALDLTTPHILQSPSSGEGNRRAIPQNFHHVGIPPCRHPTASRGGEVDELLRAGQSPICARDAQRAVGRQYNHTDQTSPTQSFVPTVPWRHRHHHHRHASRGATMAPRHHHCQTPLSAATYRQQSDQHESPDNIPPPPTLMHEQGVQTSATESIVCAIFSMKSRPQCHRCCCHVSRGATTASRHY
jgi:hypothetical protein